MEILKSMKNRVLKSNVDLMSFSIGNKFLSIYFKKKKCWTVRMNNKYKQNKDSIKVKEKKMKKGKYFMCGNISSFLL